MEIPFSNIIALSCDNVPVIIKKYTSFKRKLEKTCKHLLTFPCHSVALIAHSARTTIPKYCEEFLRKISNYINNNPKRSAIYEKYNDCNPEKNRKILRLSDTRWLSHHSCIERILKS
jgi:hypothetical protein